MTWVYALAATITSTATVTQYRSPHALTKSHSFCKRLAL